MNAVAGGFDDHNLWPPSCIAREVCFGLENILFGLFCLVWFVWFVWFGLFCLVCNVWFILLGVSFLNETFKTEMT